jgi:hypothetical protein
VQYFVNTLTNISQWDTPDDWSSDWDEPPGPEPKVGNESLAVGQNVFGASGSGSGERNAIIDAARPMTLTRMTTVMSR